MKTLEEESRLNDGTQQTLHKGRAYADHKHPHDIHGSVWVDMVQTDTHRKETTKFKHIHLGFGITPI